MLPPTGDIGCVLLVDDDPDIRRIGQLSLSKVGGWQVLLAASAEEALAQLQRGRPDLILLDVMMPAFDGPALLDKLRADPATASLPVIFLTAKAQRHEQARYRDLGAAGVIVKPFDPMALPAQIRALLADR